MWTLNYKKQICVSHHLSLNYESKSTDAHGHILTVSIIFQSNRLDPKNMIIDTDVFDNMLDRLGSDINGYMLNNNVRGNATIENFILLIKQRAMVRLEQHNNVYNNEVRMLQISIIDERGRQFIYDI